MTLLTRRHRTQIGLTLLLPLMASCGPQNSDRPPPRNDTAAPLAETDIQAEAPTSKQFAPVFWSEQGDVEDYYKNKPHKIAKWLVSRWVQFVSDSPIVLDDFTSKKEASDLKASIDQYFAGLSPIPLVIETCKPQYDTEKEKYEFIIDVNTGSRSLDWMLLEETSEENGDPYRYNLASKPKRIQSETFRFTENRYQSDGYVLQFSMPREQARALKDRLACLVVVRLSPPFIGGQELIELSIFGDIEMFFIIDKETGKTYYQYDFKNNR